MSKETKAKIVINGVNSNSPVEFKATEILATFDNEAIQPAISIDKYTFVNNEAKLLRQYIDNGHIFNCPTIKIDIFNDTQQRTVFDGLIDLTNDLEIDEFTGKLKAKLITQQDLLTLQDRLSSLSFGYLHELGKIGKSDYTSIQYVVQKKFNVLETVMSALFTYMLAKEAYEGVNRYSKDIATVTAMAAIPPLGVTGSLIYNIAVTIIDATYTGLILAALIKVAGTLLNQLMPIKRKAKTLQYRRAMTIVCSHLGYTFESNISDLDQCYYLPANFNQDLTDLEGLISDFIGVKSGLPNIGEIGYNCADFFELVRKQFNGKYAIIDNRICFYNTDDAFWAKYANYQIPSNRDKIKRYNTDELTANRIFSYLVDYSDYWTVSEYKGTSYEVITDSKVRNKTTIVRGLNEVRFGISLANRKDKDTGFEKGLRKLAKLVNSFCKTNFDIKGSTGLMVISTNNYALPKSIKVVNGRLVDRDRWSAKYIYDTYYKGTSFIQTINGIKNYGQKEVYNEVKIPFSMADFMTLIKCSECTDEKGRKGRITNLKYNIDGGYATVSYFIRQKYTDELIETYIEPDNIDI